MASTSVIGEPFSALPLYQTTNRFVPLADDVRHITNYAQCVTAMRDAEYYARGQAALRGNDESRAAYADWFAAFGRGYSAFESDNFASRRPEKSYVGYGGGCRLLLENHTKRDAWPVAQAQLADTVTRFHMGVPFVQPRGPPATMTCVAAYRRTPTPWQCEP